MVEMLSKEPPVGVITYRGKSIADTKDVEQLAAGILAEVKAEVLHTGAGVEFAFSPLIAGHDALAKQVQLREAAILHIICHATPGGEMSAEDVWGALDLTPKNLGLLLQGNGIAVVLVTACHGGVIARALVEAGVVEAAIGIDLRLKFSGARAFSRGFFRSLARGCTLGQAVADGKGQAAGRIGSDVDHLHFATRDDATAAKVAFVPPTYYVVGLPSEKSEPVVERLRAALAPDRLLYIDGQGFGEVSADQMLSGLELAKVIMVLFEGERTDDATMLDQVARAVQRASGQVPGQAMRRVRVFPLYLEGTTPNPFVPFGLLRLTPAYLEDRRYNGDVEKLAADIKKLV